MQALGVYLNQSVSYNAIETSVVVLGLAYWVYLSYLAFYEKS